MSIPDIFNANILKILGLDTSPEDEKNKFLGEATTLILSRVVERVKNGLSEEKKQEFKQIFSNPATSDREKEKFMEENVPDLEALILQETAQFKEEVIRFAKTNA